MLKTHDGLDGLGFFKQSTLIVPGPNAEQFFDLLFFQIFEVGLQSGADFGFDFTQVPVGLFGPVLAKRMIDRLHCGFQLAILKSQLLKAVVRALG